MHTYEELEAKSMEELQELKKAELERIAINEEKRQQLVREILALQRINDHSDWARK